LVDASKLSVIIFGGGKGMEFDTISASVNELGTGLRTGCFYK
jgi:hypothetical protein